MLAPWFRDGPKVKSFWQKYGFSAYWPHALDSPVSCNARRSLRLAHACAIHRYFDTFFIIAISGWGGRRFGERNDQRR